MSTFPSVRDALDNAVAQTRATRDPAVAEKRTAPRLSIEELNELDGDQLMERLRSQRYDTRGPVTRFLDVIDAPRNAIANIISPAAARKSQQAGELAAFGQPRVTASDILGEAGMKPGVLRAVAGFAGDVLTDPLTYLGPGLLKGVTKTSGAAVNIGRRGDRVLKKATKAVASGGEIKDAVTKRLYDEFVPPDITDAPARAAEFARRTRGGVSKGKDGQPSSSVIAEYYDRPANTAAMADDDLLKVDNEFRAAKEAGDTAAMQARRKALEVEDRRAAAVKDWVAEYGYGGKFSKLKGNKVDAAPVRFSPQQGVMFGDAGSQIFHVPFTEFGVWVPAFSSPAKQAVAARSMALVKEGKIPQALHMSRAWGVVQDGPKVMREVENAQAEVDNVASLNYLGDMNADSFAAVQAKRDSIVQEYNQRVQDLDNEYQQMLAETDVNKVQDLGELQTAAMMHDAALDQARLISTAVEANPFFDMITKRRGSNTIASREAFAADPYKSASKHLRDMAKGAALGEPDLRAVQQDIDRLVSETEALRSQGYKSAKQFSGQPISTKIRKGADDEYNRVMDTIINPMRANYEERLAERTKLFVETGYVEMQKAIAQMADEDIEAAMAASDAMNAYATALTKYADRTRGAMQSSISKQFDVLSESAKHMLGLDPETLGPSLFATPRTVAQNVFGDQYVGEMSMNLDAYKRTRLGNRRALINEPAARYKAARRGLADEQAALETADFHDELARIVDNPEYGISPAHYDDLNQYIYAKAIQRHPEADAYDLMTVDGTPGPLLQALERLQSSGVLKNKALQKELDALADEANRRFGNMATYEEASGLLNRRIRGYVPNTFDPQYARLVAQAPQRGGRAGAMAESFQKARSTYRHRFVDTKGKTREFFVGDRHWLELLDEQVDALPSPEIKAIAEDIRETMAEHKAVYAELYKQSGGDMGLIDELLSRPVDAIELNTMRGRFNHLTGMNSTAEKVFSDNMLYLLQNRTGASLRAKARKDFQDIFSANVLKLNQKVDEVSGDAGKAYVFEGGQKGVGLGRGKDGMNRIMIGDTVYRKLDSSIATQDILTHPDSLAAGLLDHMNYAAWMPEQQAEAVEGILRAFSPENVGPLANGVAEFNKLWKGSTLFHPAYVVGNIVGNHALLLQGRAPVGKITALYRQTIPAVTAHLRDAEWLANRKVTLNSQPTTMLEVVEQAEHYGVVGTGRTRGAMMDMYPTGELKQTSLAPKPVGFTQNLKAVGKAVAGMPGDVKQAYLRQAKWYAIHRGVDKAQPVDKIKFAVKALGDQRYLHKMFSPVAAMNSKVEDAMRLATFMGFMDDGMDAAQAARKTKEILLDYGDFTPAEASLRRYWMPFFAWIRLNGGYQLHQLFRNPKWVGMAPKLKEAVEEMVAGDEVTPEWARPMWMREELAMQVAMNPAKAVTIGSLIPTEPINRLGGAAIGGWEGIMGLLRFGASSLNPLAQGALSLGQGREMYTGRTIAPNMQGDLSPGEFIASQFRPVRELVPLGLRKPPLAKAMEEGSGAVAGRLLLGGRYQPFDRERLQFQTDREFKDRESGIRKYISIAEREGNKEASLAGRARLMALYQDHLDKGGKIPKWAQRQLAKTPQ